MSEITPDLVRHLGVLARIQLSDEEVERLRTAHANAAVPDRPAILEQLQRRLAVVNPYRLLGQATQPVAYRANLGGVLNSPVIAYWNISKN